MRKPSCTLPKSHTPSQNPRSGKHHRQGQAGTGDGASHHHAGALVCKGTAAPTQSAAQSPSSSPTRPTDRSKYESEARPWETSSFKASVAQSQRSQLPKRSLESRGSGVPEKHHRRKAANQVPGSVTSFAASLATRSRCLRKSLNTARAKTFKEGEIKQELLV